MGESRNSESRLLEEIHALRAKLARLENRQDQPHLAAGGAADTETDRQFKQRLTALIEIGNELSKVSSLDELYRQAVELGRDRLGFDRLGIWLINESDPNEFVGTFGTDDHGETRDERTLRRPVGRRGREIMATPTPTARTRYEGDILNANGEVLGEGQHVAAAMIHGEKLLGFVDMDNLLRHRLITDRDCELLGLYASTLAHLWSRVKAEQALRESDQLEKRSKEQLAALLAVSNKLSKAHSMDELCRQAVELGRNRLGFDRMGIWLISEDQKEFVGTFGTDEHGEIRDERGEHHPLPGRPDGRTREVIASGTPAAVTRTVGDLMNEKLEAVGRGFHASATMFDGEKVFGFVDVDNLLQRRPITDRDCELLGLYASALAHSCSRIKAEEALRISDQAEKRFKEKLAALLEVSNELSKIGSFDELCKRAIELGRSRLGFDRLGMWFLDEDGDEFVVGSFGTDEQGNVRDERGIRLPVDLAAREAMVRKDPMVARRMENQKLSDDRGRGVGTGSVAIATIWDGERITGSLCTDNLLKGEPITDQTCELLLMYASVLGHLCSRQRVEEAHLAQVRKLTADAEKSLEQERARISKELHDELGQLLTALNMDLAWLDGRLKGAQPALKERVSEAKAYVDQVMQTIRHLTRTLRPQLLDHEGLLDTIRSHVSEFEQRAGIACRVISDPPELEIEDPPATIVFRIVQEALTNVARYAGASECEVSVKHRDGMLEVKIVDNGRGADPADLSGTKSLGIIGMRERAAAVGGAVRVENVSAGGVCVTAELPWQPADKGRCP